MDPSLTALEATLNIRFSNPELLKQAITHSSYANAKKRKNVLDNERLEFFGDSVLKLVVSEYLIHKHPDQSEGELSKIRAHMVADRTLALIGKRLELGHYLLLSQSEKQSGGADRPSTLAAAVEAIIGAYFLDSGLDATRIFFQNLLSRFQEWPQLHYDIDYKSLLQEHVQCYRWPLPTYVTKSAAGPEHAKVFHIEVTVTTPTKTWNGSGFGASKKEAEQAAAHHIYMQMVPQLHSTEP